ncbi:MAG: gamma-glutamyltransferase [Xanthomonadales bacterium]|nr:gamma-glutamyltransferase [Gammaproteobacteria bacterium]MBT8054770.1 gamma-glutamyltransferase [Gammaproteobacteria bacterium]NND58563.1 gamma-glutamyltransferase [Xanthomonadales bacterium]NNK52257.1 gamma-glutamyltransferase [Xanthomonadales bacterium]
MHSKRRRPRRIRGDIVGKIQAPDRAGYRLIFKGLNRVLFCLLLVAASTLLAASEKPGKAAIASAHFMATEAGHEILARGGNAFDAAIAVSAALAVVEPTSSGIGGGGFWLVHRAEDGFETMIDAREQAPAAAHKDMYLDEEGNVVRDLAVNGPLAGGIPGEIAGLQHLADHYGRLPLAASLQPAIRIAREGFPVDDKFHALMNYRIDVIKRWPAAAEAYLADGELPPVGHIIRLPDLAWVLENVAEHGAKGFYTGPVAERVIEGVRAAGGIWTMEDLASYTVKERDPIRTMYGDYELVTAPPPSSGGVAIAEILNILEPYPINELDPVLRTHLIVEAMRRAYRDRAIYLGDPDFVDIPVEMLTSQFYADGLRASIRPDRATPSSMLAGNDQVPEGTDTTHFSIIDAEGNMVAATLTVNTPFGSCFMPPGTGFVVNNEMDDFSAKEGEPNAYGLIGFVANEIQPFKRPLSSMTPTFMIGEDKRAVIGTPGGSRIITMVLLGILDFMRGNEPESWVALPRFHHQYVPDKVSAESGAFTPGQVEALQAMGHEVEVRERTWGNMHGAMWNLETGEVTAGSDPRWSSGRAIVK